MSRSLPHKVSAALPSLIDRERGPSISLRPGFRSSVVMALGEMLACSVPGPLPQGSRWAFDVRVELAVAEATLLDWPAPFWHAPKPF